MLTKAAFIWSKNSKNFKIYKYILKRVTFSCDGRAEFLAAITPNMWKQ